MKLRSFLEEHVMQSRGWLLLWAVFACLVVLPRGVRQDETTLLLSALAAAVLGVFARTPRRCFEVTCIVALVSLASLAAIESSLARRTWQPPEIVPNLRYEWVNALGRDRISEAKTYRLWRVEATTDSLSLSFDVRLTEGSPGWHWQPSSDRVEVSHQRSEGSSFARVSNPSDGDPWVRQTFALGEAIGGRTVRLSLDIRGRTPLDSTDGKVYFYVNRSALSWIPVQLSGEWQEITHQWVAPVDLDEMRLSIVLNDFNGTTFDVRKLSLAIQEGDEWRAVPLSEAAGLRARLDHADRESSLRNDVCALEPKTEWSRVICAYAGPRVAELDQARAVLLLEPGLVIETRNVELSGADSASTPVPIVRRYSALFLGHPNLLGHTAVAVGLALLAVSINGLFGIVGVSAMLTAIFLSGSRGAMVAASLGLIGLGALSRRKHRAVVYLSILLAISVLAVLAPKIGVQTHSRFIGEAVQSSVAREEIWRAAWDGFLENPLSGIEGLSGIERTTADFATYWRSRYPEAPSVTHAHNLWLHFAASYGVFGLAATIWLTVGLLYLAWSWSHWRGLALVVPILILQIFDYTFFYSGVLFPLIWGMNTLRERSDAPGRCT